MTASNVKNFFSAQTFLGNRKRRKLATATYVELRDNGDIAIKYHSTDVVTYHVGGDITLRDGGWQTVTTKRRINEHTDFAVWQTKFVWYIRANGVVSTFESGKRYSAQPLAQVA